uniref:Cytochrome c oxidase subunit 2 n=1 Tax=Eucinetus haemorrhoidalis TaxID=1490181 RepID=A0A343A4A7_9COLE|nr:cytochrome c oxidase subunit II [Eucinetus haemorrhoidalis]AOY39385.1 cytochrome c oxidase subunit 2 [Eucinetus haemorrhoidalis]
MNLQDSSSMLMNQMIMFYNNAMIIIFLITFMVGGMMISLMKKYNYNRSLYEGHELEFIWTLLPTFVMFFIALPSFQMLYSLEETSSPSLTLKTIGNQWFWTYEYSDYKNIEFNSYMIPTNELSMNKFRVLDVDNRIVLPYNHFIRMLITANDVLHSWTIPSLGVKLDAMPGRLNQMSFFINRPGLFFGQCSEICGANHSFMPIVLESTSLKTYSKWIIKMLT